MPAGPARECQSAVVAGRNRWPPAPALLSSRPQSNGRYSSTPYHPRREILSLALLQPAGPFWASQQLVEVASKKETDWHRLCLSESSPARARASLACVRRQE